MTIIPPSPAGTTPSSTNPEGFLLLTIPNAILTSTSPQHRLANNNAPLQGLLSLECVTITVVDPLMDRDVWLVLRLEPSPKPSSTTAAGSFEYPLPSTQKIVLSRQNNRYTFPIGGSGGGELVLALPAPKDATAKEDLETLEVILAQYAVLQTQEDATKTTTKGTPPSYSHSPTPTAGYGPATVDGADGVDGDLKGRLVLVDEDNGQVVGMLDDHFDIREDPGMHVEGGEKDPVIVEIPEDEGGVAASGSGVRVKKQIFVHTMPVDDSDWISKTAGLLGHGVVLATNVLSTGVTTAANYYIAHSKPAPEPIVFSENTRKNIKRVHHISGKAVRVSAKTTGLIHQAVERLADSMSGGSSNSNKPPKTKHGFGGILKATTPTPNASAGTGSGKGGYESPPLMNKEGSKEWMPASSSPSGLPPSYYTDGLHPQPTSTLTPPAPPPRRRLLNRLLTSTDLLLTTVESSAGHLISHTTTSLSAAAGHKYGAEVGGAVGLVGESVKNVGVVYVDARGVGRRALLKVAGKRVVRARMGGKGEGREVVFQEMGAGRGVVFDEGMGRGEGKGKGKEGEGAYGPPGFPPPGGYSGSKMA